MDAGSLIRLLIVVMFVVGLYFAFRDRGDQKKVKCPKCDSSNVKVIDRQTENIHVETVSLPGVGGRTHVRTKLTYGCQKCGNRWTRTVQT